MRNVKEAVRDYKGRFSALPWRKYERNLFISIMFVGALALFLGRFDTGIEYFTREALTYTAPEVEAATIMEPKTIEEMKRDVLDRLEKCENPHKKPIVFDSNGVASVGQFQWQPHSFQHYWEKKTGQKLTEKEAVIHALDDEKARGLAEYVIFETDKGSAKDWVNCTKWHNLTTLVEFIKAHD